MKSGYRLESMQSSGMRQVGTSLTVYPAASLVNAARGRAEKVLVALEVRKVPFGFRFVRGQATGVVPHLIRQWLEGAAA